MLFTLKEDKTSGSFYLCHLLHLFSESIRSGAMYTNVHLYSYYITDSTMVYICPCMLLVSTYVICYWLHVWQQCYLYVSGYSKVMDKFHIIVCI